MDQFEGLATAIPVEKFSAGARDVSLPPGVVVKLYVTPLVESDVPQGFLSGTVGVTYHAKDYPNLAKAINQEYGDANGHLNLTALASNEIISTGRGRAQKV